MQMTNILTRIDQTKIMAIVRVETESRASEIAEGCLKGGIDCLEISYTLPNAGEIISYLSHKYGESLLVGAGTVIDATTARLAILSGAKFIIAPNFQPDIAKVCNRYQIPYMPGCSTYSEMVTALEHGASMIKAFPISNFYGVNLIKNFKTPLPYMPIMVSGGVTLENISDWLSAGADCVGVGGLLTKGTSSDITNNALKLKAAVVNSQK